MADFGQALREFDQHLTTGDIPAATRALRTAATLPGLSQNHPLLDQLIAATARLAAAVGAEELAVAAQAFVDGPQAQTLFDVGVVACSTGLHEVAVPALQALQQSQPDNAVVTGQLAQAHESGRQHQAAVDVLRGCTELEGDFFLQYLLAFNSIMCADLATARAVSGNWSPSGVDGAEQMAERITAMLDRADHVEAGGALMPADVRAWEYIINGSILLHLSPHGFDDGMLGRYAFLNDTVSQARYGIDRAGLVLTDWGRFPAGVMSLPDPGSQSLASAAAAVWGVPVLPYSPDVPGLVVAYTSEVDFGPIGPGGLGGDQLLWIHTCQWLEEFYPAPDLVTQLVQVARPPWQPLTVDAQDDGSPQGGGERLLQPDPTEWGQRIASAEVGELAQDAAKADDDANLRRFATLARPYRTERRRWSSSPVMSSYFGG